MSEKQAKRNRQEEQVSQGPKTKAQLSFNLMDDGTVRVSGPIQDPIAVVDILSAGFGSLVAFWAQQKQQNNRIVKAGALPPNFMLPGKG